MVAQRYRWDFIGLSTDPKPTKATSEKVTNGSTYYESDTSKLYVFYGDQWYEKTATGGGGTTYTAGDGIDITSNKISVDTATIQAKLTAGTNITIDANNEISATDTTYSNFTGTDGQTSGTSGLVPAPASTDVDKFLKSDGTWGAASGSSSGAIELTTADYNYPTTGTKTSVALWLLEPGIYYVNISNVRVDASITDTNISLYGRTTYIVGKFQNEGGTEKKIILALGKDDREMTYYYVYSDSGQISDRYNILLSKDVVNNLTSTSTSQALSANQGKELKALIDALDQRVTALGG